jgi:hypothetical protein
MMIQQLMLMLQHHDYKSPKTSNQFNRIFIYKTKQKILPHNSHLLMVEVEVVVVEH